jgi:hypothetical protein
MGGEETEGQNTHTHTHTHTHYYVCNNLVEYKINKNRTVTCVFLIVMLYSVQTVISYSMAGALNLGPSASSSVSSTDSRQVSKLQLELSAAIFRGPTGKLLEISYSP